MLHWKFEDWLAVRSGDYKLCQWRRTTLLFDLVADPGDAARAAPGFPLGLDMRAIPLLHAANALRRC